MWTIFQGFGFIVYRHRDGHYSMSENGYHAVITDDHASLLAHKYGFTSKL